MKIVSLVLLLTIFSILDITRTEYELKIKEGMHMDWEKPNLNKKFNYLSTKLSISYLV